MTEPRRLTSLDILRGATMAVLCLQVLNLPLGVNRFPDSVFWQVVSEQASHAAWAGLNAWDMIQPLFMFMVGISLPWSVAARRGAGKDIAELWRHALWRSFVFVLIGVMLASLASSRTEWIFTNVLAQIGLGYPLLFGLALTKQSTQIIAAFMLLAGVWLAHALWSSGWQQDMGPMAEFDRWFLNLLPRGEPFVSDNGYTTLNFIPSLVTMLFGVMAGERLRTSRDNRATLRLFLITSASLFAAGVILHLTGICPVIKRIWSPSFVLVTGGVIGWLLTLTWWVTDVRGHARSLELLRVVGMNSLVLYIVLHLWDPFLPQFFLTHLGWNLLAPLPDTAATFAARLLTVFVLLGFCMWLHRHKVYIKV